MGAPPVGQRCVFGIMGRRALFEPCQPRIVDDDIDIRNRRLESGPVLFARDIEPAIFAADFARNPFTVRIVDIGHMNMGALGGEGARNRFADPARCAGDERCLVFQPFHEPLIALYAGVLAALWKLRFCPAALASA